MEALSHKSSLHDLAQALIRRSCGDPGPCQKILWRAEILVKFSLGGPWMKDDEGLADAMCWRCFYESSSGILLGGSCIKIL